ncbi:MAG: hypothetical protein CMO44_05450 [Verrucomicrobiales bacterium]|nr:hypothetical protein [Verrucomicrobiales bacterium]|tara:strand:+ start:150 stop:434 length:285 start_codon:yes stop_codon:yes gene_type:complete
MIINVGDKIIGNHNRTGEIINIGIATEKTDIAAENDTALNAKTYDTSLGYTGAVTYSGENGTYWCYFDQIEDNLTEKEKSDIDVAINQENEWWK